ncbi:MAG: radical SAM/SPASM domain-containing protein, partial [Spirochaetia bacterium]
DFAGLWRDAPLFEEVRREDDYGGKCGICEYRRVCGGCRARAYASSGDYMGEEPRCVYIPGETR